ncbi:OpgC domain-containing protein [Roseospira visakhapatnamensis]|uniref:OpgC protein n=1 Tax=Roseospira visakhapatnamensis TaxID=390880 RepID=A0A7W6WBM6_9PROT|nr:OpgC domain-containing protein [Roseospira visakhapatnamensis]MBB4267681.1 hypothetical protein [Roseospira visakhapatnamensis]
MVLRSSRWSGQPSPHANPSDTTRRDLALDAIRGIFIVILTVDHMHGLIVKLTWQTFGFVTVLPGFLFISGYIVARAYGGAILKHGILVGIRRIFYRVIQIYIWHIASVTVVIGGTIFLLPYVEHLHEGIANLETFLSAALLTELSVYFNIIPLYILFLVMAGFLLIFCLKSPGLVALIGLSVWLASDIIPQELHPWGESALLKPLYWQAVFTLGLSLGLFHMQGRVVSLPAWVYGLAAVLAVLFFCIRWNVIDVGSVSLRHALFHRDRLEIGRLLNILCVFLLFSLILPTLRPWLRCRKVLVMIGQNSLIAFSLQIVIVYYLKVVRGGLAFHEHPWVQALADLDVNWVFLLYLLVFDILSIALVILATALAVRTMKAGRALSWRVRRVGRAAQPGPAGSGDD